MCVQIVIFAVFDRGLNNCFIVVHFLLEYRLGFKITNEKYVYYNVFKNV